MISGSRLPKLASPSRVDIHDSRRNRTDCPASTFNTMALNCSANYVYTIIYNGYAELVPPGLSNPHITVAGVFDTLIAANRAAEEILTRGYTGVVAAASSSAKRDSWLESLKKNGSIYHAKDTGCFRMDNYCRDFWEDPDRPG